MRFSLPYRETCIFNRYDIIMIFQHNYWIWSRTEFISVRTERFGWTRNGIVIKYMWVVLIAVIVKLTNREQNVLDRFVTYDLTIKMLMESNYVRSMDNTNGMHLCRVNINSANIALIPPLLVVFKFSISSTTVDNSKTTCWPRKNNFLLVKGTPMKKYFYFLEKPFFHIWYFLFELSKQLFPSTLIFGIIITIKVLWDIIHSCV